MSSMRTTIAGVPIPDSTIAREATELVRDVAPRLLVDHSRRVFLWGALQGDERGLEYNPESFYIGAMFHDIGLLEGHRSADVRPSFCDIALRELSAGGAPPAGAGGEPAPAARRSPHAATAMVSTAALSTTAA